MYRFPFLELSASGISSLIPPRRSRSDHRNLLPLLIIVPRVKRARRASFSGRSLGRQIVLSIL
jgi:hypothetical protein